LLLQAEDRCDALNKELLLTKAQLLDTEEEMKRLETESQQVFLATKPVIQAKNSSFLADLL